MRSGSPKVGVQIAGAGDTNTYGRCDVVRVKCLGHFWGQLMVTPRPSQVILKREIADWSGVTAVGCQLSLYEPRRPNLQRFPDALIPKSNVPTRGRLHTPVPLYHSVACTGLLE